MGMPILGQRRQAGFTLVKLSIVIAVIGIIATIAIPGLQGARTNANEASAIASLRAANSAQTTYQYDVCGRVCGHNGRLCACAAPARPATP